MLGSFSCAFPVWGEVAHKVSCPMHLQALGFPPVQHWLAKILAVFSIPCNCNALVVPCFSFLAGNLFSVNCSLTSFLLADYSVLELAGSHVIRAGNQHCCCWKSQRICWNGEGGTLSCPPPLGKPVPCSEVSAACWMGWRVGLCSELRAGTELRAVSACQGQAESQWEVPVGAFVVYPLLCTQCYLGNGLLCSRLSSRAAQMFWLPKTLNIMFLFVSLFAFSVGNKKVLLFFLFVLFWFKSYNSFNVQLFPLWLQSSLGLLFALPFTWIWPRPLFLQPNIMKILPRIFS